MTRSLVFTAVLFLTACTNAAGERCNPLRATSDCVPDLTCVYPTGYAPPPATPTPCGVSYCCALDATGNIIDRHASCQPDPEAAAACMLDMSVAADAATD